MLSPLLAGLQLLTDLRDLLLQFLPQNFTFFFGVKYLADRLLHFAELLPLLVQCLTDTGLFHRRRRGWFIWVHRRRGRLCRYRRVT